MTVREKANIKQSKAILPTKEWQNKQTSDFSETRAKFARHVASVQKPGVPNKKRHKLPSKTNERGIYYHQGYIVFISQNNLHIVNLPIIPLTFN